MADLLPETVRNAVEQARGMSALDVLKLLSVLVTLFGGIVVGAWVGAGRMATMEADLRSIRLTLEQMTPLPTTIAEYGARLTRAERDIIAIDGRLRDVEAEDRAQ